MTAAVDFWAAIFRAALVADRRAGWDELRDRGPVTVIDGVYHLTRREDALAALSTDPSVDAIVGVYGSGRDIDRAAAQEICDAHHGWNQ